MPECSQRMIKQITLVQQIWMWVTKLSCARNVYLFSVTQLNSNFETWICQAGREFKLSHSWRLFSTPRKVQETQRWGMGRGWPRLSPVIYRHRLPGPRSPAALWHRWAIGVFAKTGNSTPELSLLPTFLALLPGNRAGSPLLRSPKTSFSSLTSFLVSGNATPRGTFFFLFSKSPWPSHHLNKHSEFPCGLRLWETKSRSLHTCFYPPPWQTPPLRPKGQAICLNWKKEPGKIEKETNQEIMEDYYMALRATTWAVKLEENVSMK